MDDELIPTRATLLSRLRDLDDQAGWQEFCDTYSNLIHTVAVKSGLTDIEAQEVVQETIIGVARNLPQFTYDPAKGTFKAWMFNITRWRVGDQLRKRLPGTHPLPESTRTERTSTIDRLPAAEPPNEIEAWWDKGWENAVTRLAVEHTIQRVAPKIYQLFDLCVFKGWPASKVAKTMNVNIGQVYLAKFRTARVLKTEIRKLQKRHGLQHQHAGPPLRQKKRISPANPQTKKQ